MHNDELPEVRFKNFYYHQAFYGVTIFTWPDWITYRIGIPTKYGQVEIEVHFVEYDHEIGHRAATICAMPSHQNPRSMYTQHVSYNRQSPKSDASGYGTICHCPARKNCYHLSAALHAYHVAAAYEQSLVYQAQEEASPFSC